jgi:16S rRNA (guanine527-N7)-methyltransferase
LKVALVDSRQKRIAFLERAIIQMNLDLVRAVHMRAEEGGRLYEFRSKYDVCTARAVTRLSVLAEYCLPYLKIGGVFLAMKGTDCLEEMGEATEMIKTLGGDTPTVHNIKIPFTEINHSIIITKKVRHTPPNYPRPFSQITKKPEN